MIEEIIKNALLEISSFPHNSDKISYFINELAQELRRKSIVIYPAGYAGQLLGKTLSEHGVSIESYIDRDTDKTLKTESIPILEPQQLSELSDDTVVLVSANLEVMTDRFSKTVRQQNNQLTILNGFEINRVLRYSICSKKLANQSPFDLIECENCGFERHGCSLCMKYLKRIACSNVLDNEWRSESFDWFGYIVGQACTLKCKHCCEAIPLLKEHKFVPIDVIIEDVQKVAAASQFLTFVELVGGEPFLHPNYIELVKTLLKIKNIGYIKSFTNGTIVPSRELCKIIKDPRFMLQVSNYEKQAAGKLFENIFETRRILKEQNVKYIFTQNFEWQDFTSFELHNTDEEILKKVFRACPLHNCNRLFNGNLYRCPHQYAGVELGVLEKKEVETININSLDEKSLAKALETFKNVKYIDACRYCSMPFDAPVVSAGIQSGDLEYL